MLPDINQKIKFRTASGIKTGIITTIYTNKQLYVVTDEQDRRITIQESEIVDGNSEYERDVKRNVNTQEIENNLSKFLQLLAIQKNEDLVIKELKILLHSLSAELILEIHNGCKILVTLYGMLSARRSCILRSHPFSQIDRLLKSMKKMIFRARRSVLKEFFDGRKPQRKFSEIESEEEPTTLHEVKLSAFRPYIKKKIAKQLFTAKPELRSPKIFSPIIIL